MWQQCHVRYTAILYCIHVAVSDICRPFFETWRYDIFVFLSHARRSNFTVRSDHMQQNILIRTNGDFDIACKNCSNELFRTDTIETLLHHLCSSDIVLCWHSSSKSSFHQFGNTSTATGTSHWHDLFRVKHTDLSLTIRTTVAPFTNMV